MTDVGTTKRGTMSPMRRLRIFEAHAGLCCLCGGRIDGVREKWTVEHLRALGLGGADDDANCGPAHEDCRRQKDKADVKAIAKAKRVKAKHLGIDKPKSSLSHPRFRKLMDGSVVDRRTGEIVNARERT
ncbi:HNH endonuclease [Sinorhizobium meliloti]|nr:HNH endonuclease [Sinorhizobium meliloti]MDW9732654.1 HNH endonuclease [Sinorhizobium meliloti]